MVLLGFICVFGTFAGGSLLRRHERVHQIIGPYFERVIPATVLFQFMIGVAYRSATGELSQYAGLLYWRFPCRRGWCSRAYSEDGTGCCVSVFTPAGWPIYPRGWC